MDVAVIRKWNNAISFAISVQCTNASSIKLGTFSCHWNNIGLNVDLPDLILYIDCEMLLCTRQTRIQQWHAILHWTYGDTARSIYLMVICKMCTLLSEHIIDFYQQLVSLIMITTSLQGGASIPDERICHTCTTTLNLIMRFVTLCGSLHIHFA